MVKQSSCVPGAMSYDSFREYKTVQPCSRLFHVQTILHTWTWVGILWHGWDLHVSTLQTPGHADTAGADPQVFHKERLDWIGRPGKHPVLVPNHISMLEVWWGQQIAGGKKELAGVVVLERPIAGGIVCLPCVEVVDMSR